MHVYETSPRSSGRGVAKQRILPFAARRRPVRAAELPQATTHPSPLGKAAERTHQAQRPHVGLPLSPFHCRGHEALTWRECANQPFPASETA